MYSRIFTSFTVSVRLAKHTRAATTTSSKQDAINLVENIPPTIMYKSPGKESMIYTHIAKRKKNEVEGHMTFSNTNKHKGNSKYQHSLSNVARLSNPQGVSNTKRQGHSERQLDE